MQWRDLDKTDARPMLDWLSDEAVTAGLSGSYTTATLQDAESFLCQAR